MSVDPEPIVSDGAGPYSIGSDVWPGLSKRYLTKRIDINGEC